MGHNGIPGFRVGFRGFRGIPGGDSGGFRGHEPIRVRNSRLELRATLRWGDSGDTNRLDSGDTNRLEFGTPAPNSERLCVEPGNWTIDVCTANEPRPGHRPERLVGGRPENGPNTSTGRVIHQANINNPLFGNLWSCANFSNTRSFSDVFG